MDDGQVAGRQTPNPTERELIAELMLVERELRASGTPGRPWRVDPALKELRWRRSSLIIGIETLVRRRLEADGAPTPHGGTWVRGRALRPLQHVCSVAREGVRGTVYDEAGVDVVVRWDDDVLEGVEWDANYEVATDDGRDGDLDGRVDA